MSEQEKLEQALAACYATDPATIARLCDEHLDRSGALLGRVRNRHRSSPDPATSKDPKP